jgi:glycosyltransferase involved in cell wall biosynthesis
VSKSAGAAITISLITVCFNAAKTIRDTLDSIAQQTHPHIEYIVIDGGSTDGTQDIIRSHPVKIAKFISEPDKGLYDAMNKGLALATGDFIGFLHADDVFADARVIQNIAAHAASDPKASLIAGDVEFVHEDDTSKVVRRYKASSFTPRKLARGMMPPHPGCYVSRSAHEAVGPYDTSYRLSADFDYFVRLIHVNKSPVHYLNETLVKFRTGGASSSYKATWKMYLEVVRSCKAHGLNSGYLKVATKYPEKLLQYFDKAG